MTRRRLYEHIHDALLASARRLLAQNPDPVVRDALADWMSTAHERILVGASVDRGRRGRVDTRSLRIDCYIRTDSGPAPLCSVRARDLLDEHGDPVDARADARTLLLQLGIGVPDSPAGIQEAS
ncbi:MAG: hypothetical protein L0I76_26840 [Pseudonocardia sp.]|nr:hypothetical protein [Pseudonocardia sp.]